MSGAPEAGEPPSPGGARSGDEASSAGSPSPPPGSPTGDVDSAGAANPTGGVEPGRDAASRSETAAAGEAAASEAAAGEAAAGQAAAGEAAVGDAARRARAERAVSGTLAGALILEAITVLFVPRTVAPLSEDGLTGGWLAFLLGLAGALIVASALQRRRVGVALGTVLQLPVIATGFLVGVMFALGLLFAGVWLYLLRLRRELLGPARPPAAP
jgi:uncharacterized protein DUF4233